MPKNAEERFSDVLFYGVVLLLVYLIFLIFQPFLAPLAWASVLAVIFHSWNQDVEHRFGRTFAAVFSTIGVALILIAPVLLLTMLFIREGLDATRRLQSSIATGQFGWFNHVWDWIASEVVAYPNIDLPGLAQDGVSRIGQYLASQLGAILGHVIRLVFELFVALFALFYFLRDGQVIVDRLRNLLPFDATIRNRMLSEARELIFASVTTSLVIAAVQGLICGGAFAIVGMGSPVFWGVVMAFLSLLPVVGAWPVWIPASIWLFSNGHTGRALILIGICGGLGSTIDNILRPMFLSGSASLNGLLVFISVLGGIAVFGVLGIILGPIVVATVAGILDVYSKEHVARHASSATQ